MKTILVLTDFSDNAGNTAVVLASNMHANVLLCHHQILMPVPAFYAGGAYVSSELGWEEEQNKKSMEHQREALEAIIGNMPTDHKPGLHTICCEGDLADNVNEIIKTRDIEMIVMGEGDHGFTSHFFFSSEITAIIEHASKPILVFPSGHVYQPIEKVAFATTFDEAEIEPVHFLTSLGKLLNFGIDIVHVHQSGDQEAKDLEKQDSFKKRVAKFNFDQINYKIVNGKDIDDRLQSYCNGSDPGLLALCHHQYSYLKRLFQHSTTRDALSRQKLPLLIFPTK
ncbi:MAG: universal stress protein [Mucilaginibacter sp.]|uniref:universal stress protein n=1 Tax=Mucilaginibacter sp. TaxID=1882438 RepID=UPI003263757A